MENDLFADVAFGKTSSMLTSSCPSLLCLWGFEMSGVPVYSWLQGKMYFSLSALIPRSTLELMFFFTFYFFFFFWSVSQPEFSSVIPFLKILAWQHVLTRPVWELHLNINMYRWLKRLQQYKQLLNSEELSSKSWICVLSSFTGPETWSNSHDDDDDDDITQSLCQGKHIWELI